MNQLTVEMPLVSKCSATHCGYNVNRNCHAKAITVGDTKNPECDTFFQSKIHNKEVKRVAGVGACKVIGCQHNEDFECMMNAIAVGIVKDSINCLTYSPRQ